MMAGLFTLLALSAVMAITSFLAGILPLSVSLSRSQLRLLSIVGMGVLVGTSLIVIIPEGVETLYKFNSVSHSHEKRWAEVRYNIDHPASSPVQIRSAVLSTHEYTSRDIPGTEIFDNPGPVIPIDIDDAFEIPKTPTEPGSVGIMNTDEQKEGESRTEEESHHAWIGVALISGFVLMFLIDRLPQLASTSQSKPITHRIALNHIGRRFNLTSNQDEDDDEDGESFIPGTTTSESPKPGFATTIGLVIHAAADGIALGASSSTSQTGLSLIIFFAIMIHKAPAAFGLTSILLRQGLSKRMIRTHLILFSLAAPVGAVATWMAARVLGSGAAHNASNTKWWTGILLLFSAGTFLYVAMHSMQEVLGGHLDTHGTNGRVNGSLERRDSLDVQQARPDSPKPSLKDIGAALFGMILPLFLQVGHAH